MSDVSNYPSFKCQTSGQLLGAVVSAFRLHHDRVGGATASFIGSGDAGKRARDYFQGKWVPEETRHSICTWVVQALIHSELVPPLTLPKTKAPPDIKELLRTALLTWLEVWDSGVLATAAKWHLADRALGTFVIGRQAVIDLALRWTALFHFAGMHASDIFLHDGRLGKGKPLLEAAMKMAGKDFTREGLARALRRTQDGTINDRTVDRWFDSLIIPDDDNLCALAQALGHDSHAEAALLRFLRLQYGIVELAQLLREQMGERLSNLLFDGLRTFVRAGIAFNDALSRELRTNAEQAAPHEIANLKLFFMGSRDPVAAGWINAFLSVERGPVWHDDLQYAENGAADARIAACLKVIGDWPRAMAAISRGELKFPDGLTPDRHLFEAAAIWGMNDNDMPAELLEWISKNSERVAELTGSAEQMQAALRAEAGTASMHQGDYDGAIPHWKAAVEMESQPRRKSNYLFQYACCLWQARARRFDDAIDALRESYRLWPIQEPLRDRPFVEIAIVHQNRGWFDHALQHLDTDPEGFVSTSGHFNFVRGRTLLALHHLDDAMECFERAISLDGDRAPDNYLFAAETAFLLNAAQPNPAVLQKARRYAKQARHLGRPEAHDKWCVA